MASRYCCIQCSRLFSLIFPILFSFSFLLFALRALGVFSFVFPTVVFLVFDVFLFVFLVGAISFGFLGVRVFWLFLRIGRTVGFWCFPFPVFVLLRSGGVPLVCIFWQRRSGFLAAW